MPDDEEKANRNFSVSNSGNIRTLHVMILHAPTDLAGAEGVILNINRFIDPNKIRIVNCPFINFNRKKGAYQEELEARGIPYEAIPLVKRFEYRYIAATRDLINKYHIDVIHSHGYRSDITALIAARGKIPVVSTLHGFTASTLRIKIYEKIQQMMLDYMTTLIPVSKAIEDQLVSSGIPPEKIHLLPNVVDTGTLSMLEPSSIFSAMDIKEDPLRIVYVGRLSPEKGVDVLINACLRLKEMKASFILLIVGDGPLRGEYENMVRKYHLSKHVKFLGFRRDAVSITAASEVVVLPSRTEGIPLVVLEAMAVGKTVVASRVGGLPQLIQQHANGILFEVEDSCGLADSLSWMYHHREEAVKMGEEGKKFIQENCNTHKWAGELENIYFEAVYKGIGKDRIRILTNHPGQTESPTWNACSTRVPVRDNGFLSSIKTAAEMYLRHWEYDAIVLGAGRSDVFYALLQTFLPFGRKPCIMIDCLWYESPTRLRALFKTILMWCVDRSVDRYVVWASREIGAYSKTFHLPREKFFFIPYHTTLDTYDLTSQDGDYLFSGGNFARDYKTLIDAVREIPFKLLIACTRPELFKDIIIPDNVTVQGFSHEEYLKKMAGCTINIVPLASGLLHSGGQQTFLNSMFLGKPTIVTDPQGARDYIQDWKDGVLVEPGDPEALRVAILHLLNNPKVAFEMGIRARNKVQDLTTDDHFKKIIVMSEELINTKY